MEVCPRFDSDLLEHCFTWSSTLFWLVQSDIQTGRIGEAQHWIGKMDDMMKWLEARGDIDQVGYKPVMIRGLKAKIELEKGNRDAAAELLEECPEYIHKDVPSRAYVEYYVATMRLYLHENRHEEALPLLDELIEIHINDYKPIAAEFLYQKGLSLAELGRFEESSGVLKDYIKLSDQLNQIALAEQMEEFSTRYEVVKLQHERENMRKRFLIVVGICIALAIIIGMIIVNQNKMRHKNKILAHNISELNRLTREVPSTVSQNEETEGEPQRDELLEVGNKIVDYVNETKCYLRADCGRDTIKEGVGVPDRILAKAVVAATGLSFVNYINQLRLNVSIEMLDDKPEMTINDISKACGFGSVRQFQRIFKQHYDLSPSAYREARNAKNG